MIKLKRINSIEDEMVIYHYLYGSLLSNDGERLSVWTNRDVKEKVMAVRDDFFVYDYFIYLEKKKIGMCSLRNVDYENRKSKIYFTFVEDVFAEEKILVAAISKAVDVAFGQLNLVRLEGYTYIDELQNYKNRVMKQAKFNVEGIFEKVVYAFGKKSDVIYWGLLREDWENS